MECTRFLRFQFALFSSLARGGGRKSASLLTSTETEYWSLVSLIAQREIANWSKMDSMVEGYQIPVQTSIKTKLQNSLQPTHMEIINESNKHRVLEGSETHFKLVVVSNEFANLTLIERHRLIMNILQKEIKCSVHSITIEAKTPNEFKISGKKTKSPPCLNKI